MIAPRAPSACSPKSVRASFFGRAFRFACVVWGKEGFFAGNPKRKISLPNDPGPPPNRHLGRNTAARRRGPGGRQVGGGMRRRLHFLRLLTLAAVVLVCSVVALMSARLASSPNGGHDVALPSLSEFWGALSDRKMSQLYVPGVDRAAGEGTLREQDLVGSVIMGATPEEAEALRRFVYLLARLYPCGQCAREFSAILAKRPPKTGGRREASQWACEVHNIVNERLGKPEFDCNQCGCDEEEEEGTSGQAGENDGGGAENSCEFQKAAVPGRHGKLVLLVKHPVEVLDLNRGISLACGRALGIWSGTGRATCRLRLSRFPGCYLADKRMPRITAGYVFAGSAV
ncbi:MAG: hypothetical protein BJ554DRAFT_1912 [Olpidium bornovanus]|uniref:Sulfhydryl oxidase n=1 Tax=Olpidium bornovanus TaxID=278681 RepID=A0A8H7ZR00_9FUNG|nr:MAG: hypothetical protein BJ554DRAFT_1912 [Olpidium bornovanus]